LRDEHEVVCALYQTLTNVANLPVTPFTPNQPYFYVLAIAVSNVDIASNPESPEISAIFVLWLFFHIFVMAEAVVFKFCSKVDEIKH